MLKHFGKANNLKRTPSLEPYSSSSGTYSSSSSSILHSTITHKRKYEKLFSSTSSSPSNDAPYYYVPSSVKSNVNNQTTSDVNDVLFYGDSLTFGMAHNFTGRYDTTWPRMLEDKLSKRGFKCVESALCSRTTIFDDGGNNEWLVDSQPHYFNGLAHFANEFLSRNVSVLVLLLGTNDLKCNIREHSKFRTR